MRFKLCVCYSTEVPNSKSLGTVLCSMHLWIVLRLQPRINGTNSRSRHTAGMEYVGRGLSNSECIRLAKRLAKTHLLRCLENGAPKKQPHPWKHMDYSLRKTKLIDDNTSEEEKRRLCAMWAS